jgi:thioredoxin 1
MRLSRHRVWGLMLMVGVLLCGLVLPAWSQPAAPPKSLPEIFEFARKLCPICKGMEQVLQEIKSRYGHQVVIHQVFIDQEEYLFRRYKISIVPTQVFVDATGKEVFRHEGLFPKDKLLEKLRELKFIHDD